MGDIADAIQAGVDKANLASANNRLTAANTKLRGRFALGLLLGFAVGAAAVYALFTIHAPRTWRDHERNLYEDHRHR